MSFAGRSLALLALISACNASAPGAPADASGVVDGPTAPVDAARTDVARVDAQTPPGDVISAPSRYFPAGTEWDREVTTAAVDAESRVVIPWLESVGGWGTGSMRIDFSITVLEADATAPLREFTRTDDWFETACDFAPVPVPVGGALEGESGYRCESDGDCHLLVVHRPSQRLFEMWRADINGSTFRGGCLAVWDLSRRYPETGRGEQCTSADAAGHPIAPLLFTADEVASGEITHAIRFILPNARMRAGVYVHPATHAGAPSGPSAAPPYGARFRLRADYNLASLPNSGARVVARALQRYGMLLSDGGNIALTAQSDRTSAARWEGLLGPRDLSALRVSDFEMLEGGARIRLTRDCVRTP